MTIMVGIDMHVKTLVCELGCGKNIPKRKTFPNDAEGHHRLIRCVEELKVAHKTLDVLVAYEASGLGYVLYDTLVSQGYRCAVLAPTELLRSATGFKKKTDKKDAGYIYETVRGHVLAGNRLHSVWIPDRDLRDDRDVVRTRFDLSQKIVRIKLQIHGLLKKNGLRTPNDIEPWTREYFGWLEYIKEQQGTSFSISLDSLLRQHTFLKDEVKNIEKEVYAISRKPRYKEACDALLEIKGVGMKTAMTFLTEIGDPKRFSNRRQVGAYLGLVPSTHESGDADDRKGRITRNGPYRVRSILNQALWIHLRYNGEEHSAYERIVEKNPRRKKKAVVACMRRLAVRMWHTAVEAMTEEPLEVVA